jgi:hypothetical protein
VVSRSRVGVAVLLDTAVVCCLLVRALIILTGKIN